MKKIWFFCFLIGGVFFLTGCWGSSNFKLETEDVSRSPKLKVSFQEQPVVAWEDLIYQEIWEDTSELDTLVLAREINQESNLASYVQNAVNQLKLEGYSLSGEKTKKTEIKGTSASYPAILKTYRVEHDDLGIEVAQLFVEQWNTVFMLSYASDKPDHTKVFSQELDSLRLSF